MARRNNLVFALLLCLFAVYGVCFIYRTSFVIDGTRYFSLQDDAMVSMRYARNVASNHELVWNPGGPRIQGYTNPLWVGWMTIVHLLPISPAKASAAVQITGLICLMLTLSLVRKLAEFVGAAANAWPPAVIMTATYLPLNNWSLQGSEVAVLAPLVAGAAFAALKAFHRRTWTIVPYVLLTAAVLTRLDMSICFAMLLAFMLWRDPMHWRHHLLAGGGLLIVVVSAQLAFSWWYFGDPLPNTYYLKMTGSPTLPRLTRGAWTALRFFAQTFLGVALVALALWRKPTEAKRLLAALFLGQVAYSVYVGGDAWEWWGGSNRYVTVAMPLFFVLAGAGFNELIALSSRRVAPSQATGLRRRLIIATTLAAIVVVFNETRGGVALRQWLLIDRPMEVEANANVVELALRLRERTKPQASIAVTWAGALPYFAERSAIDLLGKTDPLVARQPVHEGTTGAGDSDFHPGHMKWNYQHSIGRLRPDVVAQLWLEPESAMPLLNGPYERLMIGTAVVFVRKDSAFVRR